MTKSNDNTGLKMTTQFKVVDRDGNEPACSGAITHASLNTSGIIPLDLRVLVLPDPVEEKTSGGIILPGSKIDQDKFATVKGTLVAVGENAFTEAKRNPEYTAPKPGDRIMIAKYGGVMTPGKDGKDYRIMNDEDVVARLED